MKNIPDYQTPLTFDLPPETTITHKLSITNSTKTICNEKKGSQYKFDVMLEVANFHPNSFLNENLDQN